MNKKEQITRMVQHTACGLQIREKEGEKESRTITGYAILFDTPSAQMYSWRDDEEVYEVISRDAVTQELLDASDIKMTMFHDRQLILARSNKGTGTLKYFIDEKGVGFEFDAPHTADGDKALELVKRGDIAGCSFAFTTHYYDENFVKPEVHKVDDKTQITYHVNCITGIYDFTLAADPAYPDTTCEVVRERTKMLSEDSEEAKAAKAAAEREKAEKVKAQLREMRNAANKKISIY